MAISCNLYNFGIRRMEDLEVCNKGLSDNTGCINRSIPFGLLPYLLFNKEFSSRISDSLENIIT